MPSLSSATDALLASRAADGDQIAFGVLVRWHAPFLVAFATKLTGSRADADDCVQEALITAWRRLPDLADPEKVRSWLTTIVSRKATDRMRARKISEQIDEQMVASGSDPEGATVASSQMDALKKVLAELPEELRIVWVLREIGGHSYDEIATEVGESAATVRGRLAGRARRSWNACRSGGDRMSENNDDVGGSGYSLEDLSAYLDRGRTPRIAAIERNAQCQALLASMERMGRLSRELVEEQAATPLADSWYEGIMREVMREFRAGRDIPLTHTDDGVEIVVTEGALYELIRSVGDDIPGLLVGRVRLDQLDPRAPLDVRVTVSVLFGYPMRETVERMREAFVTPSSSTAI